MDTQYESSDDLPRDLDTDSSGNVYVVGVRRKESQNIPYGFAIKLRGSDGRRVGEDLEWVDANGVAVDNNANVYVVGSSFTYPQWRLVIAKYPHGNVRYEARSWTHELLVPGYMSCRATDVQVTQDGTAVYLLGAAVPSSGKDDILLAKYTPNGTLLWWVVYDGGDADTPCRVDVDAQGNAYICGQTANPLQPGDSALACAKYLPDGQQAWAVQIKHASVNAIAIGVNSTVYVAGSCSSFSNHFVAAIDGNSGKILWRQSYDGPPSPAFGTDMATDIVVSSPDNVYVAGKCSLASSQYGEQRPTSVVTMKITPMTVTGQVDLDGFGFPV